jgi:hypothetical protein
VQRHREFRQGEPDSDRDHIADYEMQAFTAVAGQVIAVFV